MHPNDVEAILRAEATGPIEFPYFKDAFALKLLSYAIGGGRPISTLRRGRFARLCEHPLVKHALGAAGDGVLRPAQLRAAESAPDVYFITLAKWGGETPRDWNSSYYQTSRAGQNLVVQLGFPARHDAAYEHLIGVGRTEHPFVVDEHPVRTRTPHTLGWVRLDIDFEAGEVLIEEVQSDWLRRARVWQKLAEGWLCEGELPYLWPDEEISATAVEVLVYVKALEAHVRGWHDATLAAALHFIHERLGLRRIFFHSYESGLLMKRLNPRFGPPRSLYTDLPRRFCFAPTDAVPAMLRRDPRIRSADEAVRFHLLDLSN